MIIKYTIAAVTCTCLYANAEDITDLPPEDPAATHEKGALKVANEQDELSADVQQLIIEQTNPKVIMLLDDVENIMDETTEMLLEPDTGGKTIAAQTEIIEKIHAAAKQKQQQSKSQSGGAMMDMMERMMGKEPGDKPGDKPGKKPGDQAGQGQEGESNTGNDTTNGGNGLNTSKARRVPKAAGTSSTSIPPEFQKALDAYNRGAEEKIK